jgi:hypothetical protein
MITRTYLPLIAALGLAMLIAPPLHATSAAPASAPLPQHLSQTGLFVQGTVSEIAPRATAFSPQYPLWSDGATKRRWIALPTGSSIDASNPDAWEFPVGTKLWKEFSLGRRVETRYMERMGDGSWRFATYLWNDAGTDATLAPQQGAMVSVAAARDGRYAVPGEYDCRACHEGAAVPVLGFSALQLSSDRDPLAPHASTTRDAVDLRTLVQRGVVRNLPRALVVTPPRIAARSPLERAALGYLHGNCGHCHSVPNAAGASVPVGIVLAQQVQDPRLSVETARRSLIDAASRFRPHGTTSRTFVIVPGVASASVLPLRMRSRDARVQMPPLGTTIVDDEALALIERWINDDIHQTATQEEKASWSTPTAVFADRAQERSSH